MTGYAAPSDGRLTSEMLSAYDRDGFLVLHDFAEAADCDELSARAGEIVEDFDPGSAATIFSTTTKAHTKDKYFLASGDKVRCFFEEEAFDEEGRLGQSKRLSINKIGHALHDLDPAFDRFSRQPAIAAVAASLGLAAPRLLQSMVIFKQPHIGGEVIWHQDATFLMTEPSSVVGLWFALEDATIENGCLWALPGGHRGPLRSRFRRSRSGLCTDVLDATPWPESEGVPLEVEKGALVVLHGRLPHMSHPNRSARSRHAYTLHLIDGNSRYLADNWLQRSPDMPLRGF